MLYRVAQFFCQVLCIVLLNLRLHGVRWLPRRGGALLAANHQSFLDPVLFAAVLPRPLHFMARSTLFRNPLFGWLIHALNAFPVHRGTADREAIRKAIRLLQRGEVLLMFPEATRTPDGSLGQPRAGMSMIAVRAGVPIVPAVVDGAFRAWPRNRRLPRLTCIRVALGRPIQPQELAELSHDQVAALLNERLAALQAELRSRPQP